MSAALIASLKKRGARIVFAESCTGGLATYSLAKTPGASDVLEASFVTYSNASKAKLLGVRTKTIARHGAVSKQVALEMAQGALKKVRSANIAVAITGIAGPGGATPGKPVGTVWFATVSHGRGAGSSKSIAKKIFFRGSRRTIQRDAATAALRLLLIS